MIGNHTLKCKTIRESVAHRHKVCTGSLFSGIKHLFLFTVLNFFLSQNYFRLVFSYIIMVEIFMYLEVECTVCTKVLILTRFKWPDISVCNYLYSSPSGTRPSRGSCMLTCQRTSERIPILDIILDSMSEIVLSYMSLVKIIFQLSKLRLYQSAHIFYFAKRKIYYSKLIPRFVTF